MKDLALISGSSHPSLAKGIADHLGIELLPVNLGKFSNQETSVEVAQSVRNKHIYIIQSAAASICNKLGLGFALIHQESNTNSDGSGSMGLVGAVSGRVAIIMDDILDTGKTLKVASEMLRAHGAIKIYAIVIHGLFTMDSIKIINSSCIDSIACTNTVPQDDNLKKCPKLCIIDVSNILAETIRRSFNGESVSHLFVYE
ncbi:Ribose-phosphate pyrophosphokinase 3 [Smittium culicis]|uniref:ribose-phosphate diphosphokinase n=1 Tax=Smittium culicis TaxID=133412 RepID=A0A1R1YU22_9FUNG|nr:Ribose-phosphate pyrophosphokinase 3 [Smittium culicis]